MNKIFYIFLFISLVSCRTVKINKTEESKQSTTISKDTTNLTLSQQTKVIDSTQTTEIEFEPIDITQPFQVGNKTYKNVRFKTRKIQNNTNTLETKDVVLNQKKTTLNEIKENKIVLHEDKQPLKLSSWWWLLFILIGIYLTYITLKKLKE